MIKAVISKNNSKINYKSYYKSKVYITNIRERIFYNILLEIATELKYTVFAQVPLYAIVGLQDNLDASAKASYFNKISTKHIDFVLVDDKCKIVLCIELKDELQKSKEQLKDNKFIDKLFSDLNINFLRYSVSPVYYKDIVKKEILECINKPNITQQ